MRSAPATPHRLQATAPARRPRAAVLLGLLLLLAPEARADGLLDLLQPGMMLPLGVGALLALSLSVLPVPALWFATGVTLVAAGSVRFFLPQFGHLWWLAYGAAFLLFLSAAMSVLRGAVPPPVVAGRAVMAALGLCLLSAAVSTILGAPSWQEVLVSFKSVVMFGGLWAFLALVPLSRGAVRNWLLLLLGIGVLQLLPALYQFLVVRRARLESVVGSVEAGDAVVGTFGGNPEGGGLSAILGLFLVLAIGFVVAARRAGRLSLPRTGLALAALAVPLLLMEVKAVVVYLPVMLAVMYADHLLRRPLVLLGWTAASVMTVVAVIAVYQQVHWAPRGSDWRENTAHFMSYSFRSGESQYGRLTRLGVLEYWWDAHRNGSVLELAFGHGPGASRTQGQVLGGEAVRHGGRFIDRTGLSILLWDFGVFGLAAVLALFLAVFRRLSRVLRAPDLPDECRAWAAALRGGVPLMVMTLYYRNDLPYAAPMMFLVMATFGLSSWLASARAFEAGEGVGGAPEHAARPVPPGARPPLLPAPVAFSASAYRRAVQRAGH